MHVLHWVFSKPIHSTNSLLIQEYCASYGKKNNKKPHTGKYMLYIETCQNYTSTNSVQVQDIVHLTENHHTGKYMFFTKSCYNFTQYQLSTDSGHYTSYRKKHIILVSTCFRLNFVKISNLLRNIILVSTCFILNLVKIIHSANFCTDSRHCAFYCKASYW